MSTQQNHNNNKEGHTIIHIQTIHIKMNHTTIHSKTNTPAISILNNSKTISTFTKK